MRLLVSVTDPVEAHEAVCGRADIIDIKDPRTGALGAAAVDSIAEVRRAVPSRIPISAALGDGPFEPRDAARLAVLAVEHGAGFVKLGLRETSAPRAVEILKAVRATLPPTARLIVAGFADSVRAGSPHASDLPGIAAAADAGGCLIDTAIKDGRGLLQWLDLAALSGFVTACRARGLLSALAGSLTAADLPRLFPVSPDIIGVRGAACGGDRLSGRVAREHVAALVQVLEHDAAPTSPPVETSAYTTRVP